MTTQSVRTHPGPSVVQDVKPPFRRRVLKLENPANVGPLIHIALWLAILAIGLLVPGATNWYVAIPLIALQCLLTLSICVGILHMHTHRPLFVSHWLNRVTDILCCLPGAPTGVDMREVHVINHHRFNDGPLDVTSTEGKERGLRAIWYWITYHPVVKMHTIRTVFAANASAERRKRRHQFMFDLATYVVLVGGVACYADTTRFLLFYGIPFLFNQVNAGYFAWLSHAPARTFEDDPSKSINTVGNVLNFLIFNQGYHTVHHRYPGIHWSQIPEKIDYMRQVDPAVIVPYWMTLNSAWRVLAPGRFHNASYGERWKAKLNRKLGEGGVRARYLPSFVWV